MVRRVAILIAVTAALALAGADSARAQGDCPGDRYSQSAMWLSIAHPGLGEWYLKGWGPFPNAPQKKFWLGFIPFYGWPGYLQVKSAIDSAHCETNDDV
jgi:hypothetical protein